MPKAIIDIETLTGIGDAVREKAGSTEGIPVPALENAIREIPSGGGSAGVSAKAVNFYDYEGTILHSYTKDEFLALTEMPELPTRPGLICQGWNNTLEYMQEYTREHGVCDAGATYITDDGATRIYITLSEGRTSPMLGVGVNGTVTVDWGDGSEPDMLTGTSIGNTVFTPNHEYAEPGDYVIRLTVDGALNIRGANKTAHILASTTSTSGRSSQGYLNSINRIEIGTGVNAISNYAFYMCYNLASITIPSSVTSIGQYALYNCSSLTSIVIPNSVTTIGTSALYACYRLTSAAVPSSITSIGQQTFYQCYALKSIAIPSGMTSIGNQTFSYCYGLVLATIPNGVISIRESVFYQCYTLPCITIPGSVRSIDKSAFNSCYVLTSIAIPNSVSTINDAVFGSCYGVSIYDFSSHSSVPTLSTTTAFTGIPADCEIRVPAALYDEWIAATNWSTYAANIVAV